MRFHFELIDAKYGLGQWWTVLVQNDPNRKWANDPDKLAQWLEDRLEKIE